MFPRSCERGHLQNCEASAYAALVLGTRDYVRKCGFKQVIVGLSGGIDSALTAVIAAGAVGPENVIGVGMPGPYSSMGSIDDAQAIDNGPSCIFLDPVECLRYE